MTTPEDFNQAQRELDEQTGSSWKRVDLSGVVNGTWEPARPTMMMRADGHGLLYPGLVHTFYGESESGKSMLAVAESAQVLQDGGRVLYLDFESDEGTVGTRVLALGAEPADLLDRFDYRRPDDDPEVGSAILDWEEIKATRYDLVVIDGVTEALGVFGVSSLDNDEVTKWGRLIPKQLAQRTGGAVALIDHVTKSKDGRGRFAIGAQAKMSFLTGAAYIVEPIKPLIKGQQGVLSIRVAKDRPGGVRPHAGEYREGDRTQEVARAVFDSHGDRDVDYRLEPATDAAEWKPTGYMEKVSQCLEDKQGPMTGQAIEAAVSGKAGRIREAIGVLERDGFIRRDSKRQPFRLVRAYRENGDHGGGGDLLNH